MRNKDEFGDKCQLLGQNLDYFVRRHIFDFNGPWGKLEPTVAN